MHKNNTKEVWRALEESVLKNLHLCSITQMCQLEWATTHLKPKQVTARLNTMLMSHILESVDTCSAQELMHIMQGFRQKQNKGLYQKVRKALIDRKDQFALENDDLIDMFYTFASTKPKQFGVYRVYATEELDELIAHYEHQLCDVAE